MAGADVLPVLLFSVAALVVLLLALWQWGAGILMALSFVFTGFLLIASEIIGGIALIVRFPLVIALVIYAVFSRRNRIHLSPASTVWLLLPIVMLVNSVRAYYFGDSVLQSFLFLAFFVGVILGGQKIFADERGRAVFARTIVFFAIIMTCIQIPFFRSAYARFIGAFKSPVGFMIIGTTGVIFLVWFGMKQKFGSLRFVFYMLFSALTFTIMVLTGGRTAITGTLLGIVVLLTRRLRRNVVVLLAVTIILAPIALRIVTSFPGFEDLKHKLFSTRATGRLELYAHAWDEIKAKPLVGWGTGASFVKAAHFAGMTYHQSYLEFAVDHGIPFALLLMFLFCWYPFRGLLLVRKCQTEEMKDMANLSSALLAGYVFSSFLGGVLNATTFVLPVYSAIALQEGVRAENIEIERYGLVEYGAQEPWGYDLQEIAAGEVLE